MAKAMADTLANISAQAERRLNRLTEYYPEPKTPSLTFDDYLPRALAHAQQDEKFARDLAKSLYQASLLGGS